MPGLDASLLAFDAIDAGHQPLATTELVPRASSRPSLAKLGLIVNRVSPTVRRRAVLTNQSWCAPRPTRAALRGRFLLGSPRQRRMNQDQDTEASESHNSPDASGTRSRKGQAPRKVLSQRILALTGKSGWFIRNRPGSLDEPPSPRYDFHQSRGQVWTGQQEQQSPLLQRRPAHQALRPT